MYSFFYLLAQENGDVDIWSSFPVEQVFGGAVLLLLLWLLLSGRVRIEREVTRESDIIKMMQETIDKQRETIKALTQKDRETLHLLRELRTAAIARGDLQFSDMIEDKIGDEDA